MGRLPRLVLVTFLALGGTARAADTVIGTFTVNGKTIRLASVHAERAPDPRGGGSFLILLVSDVPVAPADRAPDRLALLARGGQLHAVRVSLTEGLDRLIATPYHRDIPESGQPTVGGGQIDLTALDEQHVEATVQSRMVGQYWHYSARVKAALAAGIATELEMMDTAPVRTPTDAAGAASGDPSAIKRALGGMGYVYNEEEFVRTISDGNAEAVALFLRVGMSPNTRHGNGTPALPFAATQCAYGKDDERVAIIKALIAAKADVKGADSNGSTALIWAAQSCPLGAVEALIAAGADVNAKARGGATPLMMAEVMQRAENAAALKKAGAKPWK